MLALVSRPGVLGHGDYKTNNRFLFKLYSTNLNQTVVLYILEIGRDGCSGEIRGG